MSVEWILILALALAIVFAGAAVILVWLVFGMSDTLRELLLFLKDQHDERSDAAAKAVETRTRRYNVIVTKLVSVSDHLQQLRDITSRIEVNTAMPKENRKTRMMKASPPGPADADAPEQPATMQVEGEHGPVLLPAPPSALPTEASRDSQADTLCWESPSSAGTLVSIGAVPAK